MKPIEFDFGEPFTRILTMALSLPMNGSVAVHSEEEVKQAARCLYEAAHGRSVDTRIGPITIAPAVAAALKGVLFPIKTRSEFIAIAEAKSSFRRSAATLLNGFQAEPIGGK